MGERVMNLVTFSFDPRLTCALNMEYFWQQYETSQAFTILHVQHVELKYKSRNIGIVSKINKIIALFCAVVCVLSGNIRQRFLLSVKYF